MPSMTDNSLLPAAGSRAGAVDKTECIKLFKYATLLFARLGIWERDALQRNRSRFRVIEIVQHLTGHLQNR